jgi:dTDP-4-dehydrorhamnose reductase
MDMVTKNFLITGAGAQLGVYFQRLASRKGLKSTSLTRAQLDITNRDQLLYALDAYRPDILINCASYNLIDLAQEDSKTAYAVNTRAVEELAKNCRDRNIFLVHYSSAHVFDGENDAPYRETDSTNPVNAYGKSKLEGEQAVQSILKNFLLLRLSWVFGTGKNCFLTKVSQWAKTNPVLTISSDEISIPAYSQDVVEYTFKSLEKGLSGLYHLTSNGFCSRAEYVEYFVQKMGMLNKIKKVPAASFNLKAKRPLYSRMSNEKISQSLGEQLPLWQDGLDRFVSQLKNHEF